jgi:hypothetical protein
MCVECIKAVAYALAPIAADLSPIVHVALVRDNHALHIARTVLFDVAHPVFDVVKRLFVGDIVHEQNTLQIALLASTKNIAYHGSAVVGSGDRAEPLLSSSVPYLQLDLLAVNFYRSNFEVDACTVDDVETELCSRHNETNQLSK